VEGSAALDPSAPPETPRRRSKEEQRSIHLILEPLCPSPPRGRALQDLHAATTPHRRHIKVSTTSSARRLESSAGAGGEAGRQCVALGRPGRRAPPRILRRRGRRSQSSARRPRETRSPRPTSNPPPAPAREEKPAREEEKCQREGRRPLLELAGAGGEVPAEEKGRGVRARRSSAGGGDGRVLDEEKGRVSTEKKGRARWPHSLWWWGMGGGEKKIGVGPSCWDVGEI
jgi:hypothetical protein